MDISFGKIANALKSTAADHVLGVANDIYDETLQKYQSDINASILTDDVAETKYLVKSGDTMTGDLTIKTSSSGAPSVIFQREETNDTYEDWKLTNYLGNFKIQNRNSSDSWVDIISLSASSNKNISTSYNFNPSTNNTLNLGSTSLKWNNVYATTFNGALKGNADTATKLGTTTIGSVSLPIYLKDGVPTAVTGLSEAYLTWGGKNISNGITPLDVAMDSEFSANRLSFMPGDNIKIEFSRDNGTTWHIYPNTMADSGTENTVITGYTEASAEQKQSLVTSGLNQSFYLGARSKVQTADDLLRITITAAANNLYFSLKKILIYYSQAYGSGNCCKVEVCKCGSNSEYTGVDDVFTEIDTYNVAGWTNWNSIPLICNFGGGDNQTGNNRKIRLTFSVTGVTSTTNTAIYVNKIRMYGETVWSNSNGYLAQSGHMYTWDINKHVIFPSSIRPKSNAGGDLGNSNYKWNNVFANTINVTRIDSSGNKIMVAYGNSNAYAGAETSNTVVIGNVADPLNIRTNGTLNHYKSDGKKYPILDSSALKNGTTKSSLTAGSITTVSNRQYAVELDANNKLSVNVPWENTNTNDDTKNTAGATNSTSKLYLIGATSQTDNPQTYSNSSVYMTNGILTTPSFEGSWKGITTTDVNSAYEDSRLKFYYQISGCATTVSTDGKRYAGTANSFGFPVTSNANSMLWVGSHSGNYGHQLGFSSNGRIYDRCISNGVFSESVNGGSWKELAYTSDIKTYTNATTSAAGLMSSSDKTKLDGIATGANNYTHPTDGANTGSFGPSANVTPNHGGTFNVPYLTVNGAGHVTAIATKTVTLPTNLISTTYSNLQTLISNNGLQSGSKYRINDYQTVVNQTNVSTNSNSKFDIIVTAISTNQLSENAKVCERSGITYFNNCKLDSWEIKYCFANDTNRFAWASSSGKGVIYYMKDEYNNEAPYDFKSILFNNQFTFDLYINSTHTDYSIHTNASSYCYNNKINLFMHNNKYQLNRIIFKNTSTIQPCYNNIFGPNCNNISFNYSCYSNSFGSNCYNITLGNQCSLNKFGDNCYDINMSGGKKTYTINNTTTTLSASTFPILADLQSGCILFNTAGTGDCKNNEFGNNCHHISLLNTCNFNKFGSDCSNIFCSNNNNERNIFGDSCSNILLNYKCSNNKFGSGCDTIRLGKVNYNTTNQNNEFGNYCKNITFYTSYCSGNRFGHKCQQINFTEGHCYNNTFGNYCYNTTLGQGCYDNVFGDEFGAKLKINSYTEGVSNYDFEIDTENSTFGIEFGANCYCNKFGNQCRDIVISSGASPTPRICYNDFETGCQYITLITSPNIGSSDYFKNYMIRQSIKGSSSTSKQSITITSPFNRDQTTYIEKKNGTIYQYNGIDASSVESATNSEIDGLF